jgi:electron transfer flavoprotein beta subunit
VGERQGALKTALAMGCGQAILISDPALEGADSQVIARVLAAAIQKTEGAELAVFGKQAIDGDMGVTGAQTARSWAGRCSAWSRASRQVGRIQVERSIEEGRSRWR